MVSKDTADLAYLLRSLSESFVGVRFSFLRKSWPKNTETHPSRAHKQGISSIKSHSVTATAAMASGDWDFVSDCHAVNMISDRAFETIGIDVPAAEQALAVMGVTSDDLVRRFLVEADVPAHEWLYQAPKHVDTHGTGALQNIFPSFFQSTVTVQRN